MKIGLLLCCSVFLTLGAIDESMAETFGAIPSSPAVSLTAEDQFFVDHPDLKNEGAIVDEASKALAAEGYKATDAKEASETLTARSRALLAQRSPEDWQRKAVSMYPALGVAGSEFNLLFLEHYRELQSSSPGFEQEPSWPVLLAQRCDDELRGNQGTLQQLPPSASTTSPTLLQSASSHPQGSGSFGSTSLVIVVLLLLTAIPGALLFLKLRGYSFRNYQKTTRPKNDAPAWRAALKPAAAVYLISFLPAAIHTSMANADLAFGERMVVSLLVGILFGLFITIPFYGLDTLWQVYHQHQAHSVRPAGH